MLKTQSRNSPGPTDTAKDKMQLGAQLTGRLHVVLRDMV